MDIVADRIPGEVAKVRQRILDAATRSGRRSSDVRIIAAVKYGGPELVAPLLRAGIEGIADNRLDALISRQDALGVPATPAELRQWHFIGRLQSRQTDAVADRVGMIETLCSESAARRLISRSERGEVLPQVLIQVNIAGDPAKDGLDPSDVSDFLEHLAGRVPICGLMTMPAATSDDNPEASRGAFRELRELLESLRDRWHDHHPLTELSMGTSQDFEVAVEEGATIVRLGRVLYGAGE